MLVNHFLMTTVLSFDVLDQFDKLFPKDIFNILQVGHTGITIKKGSSRVHPINGDKKITEKKRGS